MYKDKDGRENRERVEPENTVSFDPKSFTMKKNKMPLKEAMKNSFVRENTVADLVYMDRLIKIARGVTGTGIVNPIIPELSAKMDPKRMKELVSRVEKEMSATMPKREEVTYFFTEPSIRERVLSRMGSGSEDTPVPKSLIMRETEREMFLIERNRQENRIREEIQSGGYDAKKRAEIMKQVEAIKNERRNAIEEWKKQTVEEDSATGSGAEASNGSGSTTQSGAVTEPVAPAPIVKTPAPAPIVKTPVPAPTPVPVVEAPKPKDTDGDEIPDMEDNCPGKPNPGQRDADGDGMGDLCDSTPFGVKMPAVSSEPVVR
ncbi:MAG: hypothetical protein QG650_285 [Patescibacteria group bacterium]|nr:hypothetical protein [Patescibacteria group bacterium]